MHQTNVIVNGVSPFGPDIAVGTLESRCNAALVGQVTGEMFLVHVTLRTPRTNVLLCTVHGCS